jgi:hypothetical protein
MNRRQRFIRNFLDRFIDVPRRRVTRQSIRKSKRCISNTVKYVQCRKRTAHSEKCWVHLAAHDNLRIKPSNIINGGKGLFSWKKPIPRGRIIGKFTGRLRTKQQLDQRYGTQVAQYAICNSRGRCIDANHTTDGAVRFANDSRGSPFQNNAKIKGRNTILRSKATKAIPANQEIFTSYGRDYWQ